MEPSIILVANPGTVSRKYSLYEGKAEQARVLFEMVQGRIACTLEHHGTEHTVHTTITTLDDAGTEAVELFRSKGLLGGKAAPAAIGLCMVAPGAFFLEDRLMDDETIHHLETLLPRTTTPVTAMLEELHSLRRQFPESPIAGISDSAFHRHKPDYAWNYGISLEDADRFEIKRFGYHGLSAASIVSALHEAGKLPSKLVVCHLGSGASVTAICNGRSIDNTMGYSPLDGMVMGTRSGSIDPAAVHALKVIFRMEDRTMGDYLHNHSGLLGLGGSADLRELLARDANGDHRARLALQTYTYSAQKAIGQMAAALGGADMLVFTGTVGERSAAIRAQIIQRLHYLDFIVDEQTNVACTRPTQPENISRLARSKPVFVVPTGEASVIATRTAALVLATN